MQEEYLQTVSTFDKFAEQYQEKYMHFDLYISTYKKLSDLIDRSHSKVLDIACGPGNISAYLQGQRPNLEIVGLDLSPGMVKLAQVNNPGAQFKVMDARYVSNLGAGFDVIACGFVVPYLNAQDAEKLLIDTYSLLRKNGLLYLSTMEGKESHSGRQTSPSGDSVFVYYHSTERIKNWLNQCGYTLLECESLPFPDTEDKQEIFFYAVKH